MKTIQVETPREGFVNITRKVEEAPDRHHRQEDGSARPLDEA